jgi:flagellar biogenesis protein FliO
MASIETNIGAAYFYMFVGALGLIIIAVYVILKILFYFKRKNKDSSSQKE